MMLAMCIAPASSSAAAPRLTVKAKPTAIAGANLAVTAHITPAVTGLGVTLQSGNKRLGSARTNKLGNATFSVRLTTDTKLRATLNSRPSVQSPAISVTVYHHTKLLVDWPDYTLSCTGEGIDAYISPAVAGRTVVMQYIYNGAWITEDTQVTDSDGYVRMRLGDNSNAEAVGTTMTATERMYVPSKGRYLPVSAKKDLSYDGCGDSSGPGSEVLTAYYTGDGVVGSKENFSWDVANTDPFLWDGKDATMQFDVCSGPASVCDASDPSMPTIYQDITTITGDSSGNFTWHPTTAGEYVARVSLWDAGTMLTYASMAYPIGK